MEQPTIPLLVVAGPTASGKTSLAVGLASRIGGEVVSADSMQVYADLSVGTARPTTDEMAGIPHHLLGFLSLDESYSVARYVKDAHRIIAEIHARGRQAVLCGGTGLYIQSLLDNLTFFEQDGDTALREALRARAQAQGGEVLLEELRQVDPETADRLHPHDIGRITRALEVYQTTGLPISEQARRARTVPSPYAPCLIVLDARERQVLYDRINRRVDAMLEAGLLEEAGRVLQSPHAATAAQAIGYKELAPYFAGSCSLEEAVEHLKQGTRRYAKRQLSWFRRMKNAQFLYIDDYQDPGLLCDAALSLWEKHRKGEAS